MSKILVADDEEELLELIRFSLDAHGYQVTVARNGKQAVELTKKNSYDLIILDVMMPMMDGYHAASEINQDPQSPPILLLTSRDFDQDQAAIKGSGATAFLSKPFEIPELIQTVQDVILGKNDSLAISSEGIENTSLSCILVTIEVLTLGEKIGYNSHLQLLPRIKIQTKAS